MKGNIYPVTIKGNRYYTVRFGTVTKTFKALPAAERFLTGIRYETDRGTYDPRDYRKDHPLAFSSLTQKWLEYKQRTVRPKTYTNLRCCIAYAEEAWGTTNIKTIGYAEIEDLLYSRAMAEKTRSNWCSILHDFWWWCQKRKILTIAQMPEFPEIRYELGWRNIIDIDTQHAVIDKVAEMTAHDPKISMGIRWLCTYISIRPGELRNIRERDIQNGVVIIPHPKEKKPKMVYLLDEDIEVLKQFPASLPDLYFFRHPQGTPGAVSGKQYSHSHLYNWWKRACGALGVGNVDLYGGTRHSTATALSKVMSPEQIRTGTMHSTNKAFERYMQRKAQDAKQVYAKIRGMRVKQKLNTFSEVVEFKKPNKINS